jgi:hypothetical protein
MQDEDIAESVIVERLFEDSRGLYVGRDTGMEQKVRVL